MSAESVAKLRSFWEKLTFAPVTRLMGRQPEDVRWMEVHEAQRSDDKSRRFRFDGSGDVEYMINARRLSEVPEDVRWRTVINWKHYYGFAGEYFFHSREYDGSGRGSRFPMLTDDRRDWVHLRPPFGQVIAGYACDDPRGKRLEGWFVVEPPLEKIIWWSRNGLGSLTETDLAHQLISPRSYRDQYWAVARLLFFDNVQAFVDEYKKPRANHPCASHIHEGRRISTGGLEMEIPGTPAQIVHWTAHKFEQIGWWEEFLRLTQEQGVPPPPSITSYERWESPRDCLDCLKVIDPKEYDIRWATKMNMNAAYRLR